MDEQNWSTLAFNCGHGPEGYHYTVEKIQYSEGISLRKGDKLVKLNQNLLSKCSPEEFCSLLPRSGCVELVVEPNQSTGQSNGHGSASARCPMQSSCDVTLVFMLTGAEMMVLEGDSDDTSVSVDTCFYSILSCICKAVRVVNDRTYLGWGSDGPVFQSTNMEITMLTLRADGKDYVGFRFPGDCFLKCGEDREIDAMPDATLLKIMKGEKLSPSRDMKLIMEDMKSCLFQREGVTDSCKFQSCKFRNYFLIKNGDKVAISDKGVSECDFEIEQPTEVDYGQQQLPVFHI